MPGACLSNSQLLSNMLRRRYIFGALLVGLFVVNSTANPPLNRRNRMGFIIDNAVTIDCVGSHANSSECRALEQNESAGVLSIVNNSSKVEDDDKSWNLTRLLDDNAVDEGRIVAKHR